MRVGPASRPEPVRVNDIDHVIFDKRIWTAGVRSERGWRDYDPGNGPGDRKILEHRDHVHVDVP